MEVMLLMLSLPSDSSSCFYPLSVSPFFNDCSVSRYYAIILLVDDVDVDVDIDVFGGGGGGGCGGRK